jgi:hypothetical protein
MTQIILIPIKIKKNHLDPKTMGKILSSFLDKAALSVQDDLAKPAKTWTKQPRIIIKSTSFLVREIYTENQIYQWLNDGTRKNYPIPKNLVGSKMLRFQEGYKAKTRVRVLGSSGGGKFGKVVFRKRVIHPGITARHWVDEVVKKWERKLPKDLRNAIKQADI